MSNSRYYCVKFKPQIELQFGFRLANIVEGKVKQQFDKDGILFIDEDPKDFVYILR